MQHSDNDMYCMTVDLTRFLDVSGDFFSIIQTNILFM